MEHIDLVSKFLNGPGVEIGAFTTPIPHIKPYYVDRFDTYANEKTLADYYGDACELPFYDSSLAYVVSSHVIEHTANPVAAFKEWYRVLGHEGIIYMVVPDRRLTFDHPRPLTPVSHMIEDYERNVTQVDGTHIDDFVYGVDWALFSPSVAKENVKREQDEMASVYRRAIASNNEINIHFHTFEPESMIELLSESSRLLAESNPIEILEVVSQFPSSNPNGFAIVARVHKPNQESIQLVTTNGSEERPIVREDARTF